MHTLNQPAGRGGAGSEGQPRQHDARSSDGAGRGLEPQASLGFPSRKAFPAVTDHGSAGLPREVGSPGLGYF